MWTWLWKWGIGIGRKNSEEYDRINLDCLEYMKLNSASNIVGNKVHVTKYILF